MKRDGSRPYLYLSRRDATGQVVKVYVGTGANAQAAAQALARRHAEREAIRRTLHEAVVRLQTVDGLTTDLNMATAVLLEAYLLAEGFHRHNFGPWRRRRDGHGR